MDTCIYWDISEPSQDFNTTGLIFTKPFLKIFKMSYFPKMHMKEAIEGKLRAGLDFFILVLTLILFSS